MDRFSTRKNECGDLRKKYGFYGYIAVVLLSLLSNLPLAVYSSFIKCKRNLEESKNLVDLLKDDCKLVFDISVVLGALHILFLIIIITIVMWFRKTKAVTSRGPIFLAHLCVSMMIAIGISIYYTKNQLNELSEDNNFEAEKLGHLIGSILAFFCANFFSAIAIRMRIIYESFTLLLNKKQSLVLNHFKYYYVDLFIWTMATLPNFLRFGGYIPNTVKAKYAIAIIPIFYSILIGFFTYKCRKAATEFSDFYTNLRSLLYCIINFSSALVLHSASYTALAAVAWQLAIQSTAVNYTLDSILELTIVEFNLRKKEREKTKRVNMATSAIWDSRAGIYI
ncbi:uncharacterized protein LOC135145765 [Zophobas morio]|uniref:uncharacterized protein LOC135145765 n=1 Tax=Zophobas morio TaxID=2755281 RepID=UPI0030833874